MRPVQRHGRRPGETSTYPAAGDQRVATTCSHTSATRTTTARRDRGPRRQAEQRQRPAATTWTTCRTPVGDHRERAVPLRRCAPTTRRPAWRGVEELGPVVRRHRLRGGTHSTAEPRASARQLTHASVVTAVITRQRQPGLGPADPRRPQGLRPDPPRDDRRPRSADEHLEPPPPDRLNASDTGGGCAPNRSASPGGGGQPATTGPGTPARVSHVRRGRPTTRRRRPAGQARHAVSGHLPPPPTSGRRPVRRGRAPRSRPSRRSRPATPGRTGPPPRRFCVERTDAGRRSAQPHDPGTGLRRERARPQSSHPGGTRQGVVQRAEGGRGASAFDATAPTLSSARRRRPAATGAGSTPGSATATRSRP